MIRSLHHGAGGSHSPCLRQRAHLDSVNLLPNAVRTPPRLIRHTDAGILPGNVGPASLLDLFLVTPVIDMSDPSACHRVDILAGCHLSPSFINASRRANHLCAANVTNDSTADDERPRPLGTKWRSQGVFSSKRSLTWY
ncbi:hypothetical protein SCP_0406380 [Sparassis crispa]|uniref:Uncharacterized protein n=1 Tax=Sparassis crispa TaxID=139825 RepID=A0A401GJB4_9APHY|nr:hypothetical protein SCP_0406380 [Sparassis crispa]GBE82254.1 hypothetical protein SCP_0406380 [Sparassis crispa]